MSLPTLDKTWQFTVNNAFKAQGTTLATAQLTVRTGIKDPLIGFGSNPWTVRGSSNSVAAAMDAVDRWAADANLVWANVGSAHSWIVLRQTGIATNFELCMDLTSAAADGQNMVWVVSPSAGFTGGTTLNRPTATDEIVLVGAKWGATGTNQQLVTHLMQSTDGQCTRIIVCQGNVSSGIVILDKVKAPVSGWTNPSYAIAATSNGAEQGTISNFYATANGRGYHNSIIMSLYATCEGYGASGLVPTAQTSPNDISGEFPMSPMGIASDTGGCRGRHGDLFDLWYGLASGLGTGTSYPNANTKQFVQFGDIVFPWDGVAAPVMIC
jgi:hypothetical protein